VELIWNWIWKYVWRIKFWNIEKNSNGKRKKGENIKVDEENKKFKGMNENERRKEV
jgi:hypothetical protein